MARSRQRSRKKRRGSPVDASAAAPRHHLSAPADPVSAGSRRATIITLAHVLAVVAVAVALYARTYSFDYTYLDDDMLIANDMAFLSDLSNLPQAFRRTFFSHLAAGEKYYRPLITSSFMVDAAISGGKLTSFHLTNVLLHVLASALFLLLLLRLHYARSIATIAALLFCVHPVMVGAIAWIPGRVYLLLASCSLGALLLFLQWVESRSLLRFAGHVVLIAAALLCQEGAVVLPLLLAAWLWIERGGAALREPRAWFAWGAVLVGWAAVWIEVASSGSQKHIGQYVTAFFEHLPALLIYLGKMFLPYRLAVLPTIEDSSLVPGAITVVVLAVLGSRLRGRPLRRLFWGLFWVLAWTVPSLPATDYVLLEGRLYVAMPGALLMLLALLEHYGALDWMNHHRRPSLAAVGVVLAIAATVSWNNGASYRDRNTFTKEAVAGSPSSGLAHQSRGLVLYRRGDLAGAEFHFREAVRLGPKLPVVNGNLGAVLLARNQLEQAQVYLERELARNPGNDQAHYNLGTTLERRGEPDRALVHFRLATEFNPRNINAFGEMLKYYARRGMTQEAERCIAQMKRLGVVFTQRPAPPVPHR